MIDLMGVIGNRGNRGEALYSSETEGFNHAALVFEERSQELCMSSIAPDSNEPGHHRLDFRER